MLSPLKEPTAHRPQSWIGCIYSQAGIHYFQIKSRYGMKLHRPGQARAHLAHTQVTQNLRTGTYRVVVVGFDASGVSVRPTGWTWVQAARQSPSDCPATAPHHGLLLPSFGQPRADSSALRCLTMTGHARGPCYVPATRSRLFGLQLPGSSLPNARRLPGLSLVGHQIERAQLVFQEAGSEIALTVPLIE